MGEIIDKVKDKAIDIKDKVVDDTKDIVNMTKDSARTPSIASSYSAERKYTESDLGIETRKTNVPITEYRDEVKEKIAIPTNIKIYQSASEAMFT
jgi:hypothetical protein